MKKKKTENVYINDDGHRAMPKPHIHKTNKKQGHRSNQSPQTNNDLFRLDASAHIDGVKHDAMVLEHKSGLSIGAFTP